MRVGHDRGWLELFSLDRSLPRGRMMATAQAYVGAKSAPIVLPSVDQSQWRERAVQALSFNKGVADASAIPWNRAAVHTRSLLVDTTVSLLRARSEARNPTNAPLFLPCALLC